MAAVAELIRTEADGKISFGNHLLQEKSKKYGLKAARRAPQFSKR